MAYTAAISCQRRYFHALKLFASLSKRGLRPNLVVYSALIAVCDRDEQWQWAIHLLTSSEMILTEA